MSVYAYKGRVFTLTESLFWIAFLCFPTGLGLGALFTKQDPPVPFIGWAIIGIVILCLYGGAGAFLYLKWKRQKNLRLYISPPGLAVGWDNDRYCVSGEAVSLVLANCLIKMREAYPCAEEALRGCIIWFREPVWAQQTPSLLARKVAGVQDGQLIVVGWREDLTKTALEHELAHRIIQVCGGDPPEDIAHAKMSNVGIK
jgi:hypothetical protein